MFFPLSLLKELVKKKELLAFHSCRSIVGQTSQTKKRTGLGGEGGGVYGLLYQVKYRQSQVTCDGSTYLCLFSCPTIFLWMFYYLVEVSGAGCYRKI